MMSCCSRQSLISLPSSTCACLAPSSLSVFTLPVLFIHCQLLNVVVTLYELLTSELECYLDPASFVFLPSKVVTCSPFVYIVYFL